jgi:hypothetical protein
MDTKSVAQLYAIIFRQAVAADDAVVELYRRHQRRELKALDIPPPALLTQAANRLRLAGRAA